LQNQQPAWCFRDWQRTARSPSSLTIFYISYEC
jgi:hypothetical protein